MLNEFSLLNDIVKDLTDPLRVTGINKLTDSIFYKDEKGRNVLIDEEQEKTIVRPAEGVRYYTAILKEQIQRYCEVLSGMSVQELKRTKTLRERELASYYEQAGMQIKKLNGPLELPDYHRINALWDLTQGYIALSLVVYQEKGIVDFMHVFLANLLPQELDAIATFADEHGIVDFNTFKKEYSQNDVIRLPSGRTAKQQTDIEKYDLLRDYPEAKNILSNFVGENGYLEEDYQLKPTCSKAIASVIAYSISTILRIQYKARYFETFWRISDIKGAFSQTQDNLRFMIFEIACLVAHPEYKQKIMDAEKLNLLKTTFSRQK